MNLVTEIYNYFILGYLVTAVSMLLMLIKLLILVLTDKTDFITLTNRVRSVTYKKSKLHYLIPYYGLFELLVFIYNLNYYFKTNDLIGYIEKSDKDSSLF